MLKPAKPAAAQVSTEEHAAFIIGVCEQVPVQLPMNLSMGQAAPAATAMHATKTTSFSILTFRMIVILIFYIKLQQRAANLPPPARAWLRRCMRLQLAADDEAQHPTMMIYCMSRFLY